VCCIDQLNPPPIAVSHELEDLTLVISTRQARAVIQFSGHIFQLTVRNTTGIRDRQLFCNTIFDRFLHM
jgi:hypothetical protein